MYPSPFSYPPLPPLPTLPLHNDRDTDTDPNESQPAEVAAAAAAAQPKRTTLDMAVFQRNNSKKMYDEAKRSGVGYKPSNSNPGIQSPVHAPIPWHTLPDDRKQELLRLYQEDMPDDLVQRFISSKKKGAVGYDPFKRRILQLGTP